MRGRWLTVVAVASLCLNVAVVGAYFAHRVSHSASRRFAGRGLTREARERLRQVRKQALPEFAALAGRLESTDSLLWIEMKREIPDSVRVESLCQELGRIHGTMRAMVFRQMHRELQMLPGAARAEYLQHMMMMRPGLGGPGRGVGPRMHRRPMGPHDNEPLPGEPPPGPPPEAPGSGE